NCEVESLEGSHAPGDFFPVGPTSVIYTAVDVHGNPSYSGFVVEVIDIEPPEIEQQPDVFVFAEPGEEGASVSWEIPEVTDNCGVESLSGSHEPGDFFPVGTTVVVYTAEDIHGNTSTMEFQVIVMIIDPDIPEFADVSGFFTIDDGEICVEALQTIHVSNAVFEPGAQVNLVAGHSILFTPGVEIQAGANVHAYIDQDGTFCGDLTTLVSSTENDEAHDDELPDMPTETDVFRDPGLFFKVYPNPTEGVFTLEVLTHGETESMLVEVYSLLGGRIIQRELPLEGLHALDLTGHQPGLYIVRVMSGDKVGVERLIKR
ncbi:MAG: HYR domain-containing protein, partial [Bacteroidia bacterium]